MTDPVHSREVAVALRARATSWRDLGHGEEAELLLTAASCLDRLDEAIAVARNRLNYDLFEQVPPRVGLELNELARRLAEAQVCRTV